MIRVPISPFVDTALFLFQVARHPTGPRNSFYEDAHEGCSDLVRQRGGGGPNLCGPPGGKGPRNKAIKTVLLSSIAQFRYIKIQPKTIDLSTRLVGITTEFVGFIPTSLVLRSIVLG